MIDRVAEAPDTASNGSHATHSPSVFVTTHWSVVLAAGHVGDIHSRTALARLCETYWHPLYAYTRRRGYSPEDAQDLTQEFFARLLEHNWVGDADRDRGRFRTFLLTALNRFLANEWDRARAQKRGGGVAPLSLDTPTAENRYQAVAAQALSPDQLYDRRWAMTLLDRALNQLEAEQTQAGKSAEYAVLRPLLTSPRGDTPYSTPAKELGMSEAAVRMATHRLRKRFRELFRAEIVETVTAPEDVEEEIRHLIAAMGD